MRLERGYAPEGRALRWSGVEGSNELFADAIHARGVRLGQYENTRAAHIARSFAGKMCWH